MMLVGGDEDDDETLTITVHEQLDGNWKRFRQFDDAVEYFKEKMVEEAASKKALDMKASGQGELFE